MSKSLVHIRMSEKNNFLHEHEIFEMMKSRQLYQMQFELKRKLEKRIRAIELAEKVHISTFQSRKIVFLNKMREKIRQKNLRRYSKEIEQESDEEGKEIEFLLEEENDDHLTQTVKQTRNEKVLDSLRSKSLVNILPSETEEKPERPITSRSVVSLRGKSFPVAKSSGRKQLTDKALVTEVTMYPTDLITEVQAANDASEHDGTTEDANKNNYFEEKSPEKDIKFNLKGMDCRREKTILLPTIPNKDIIKSLATFEMGTLTPEGHLLLTRDDYNDYMEKFQRKREKRLHRIRSLSESLDQKVRDFRVEEE